MALPMRVGVTLKYLRAGQVRTVPRLAHPSTRLFSVAVQQNARILSKSNAFHAPLVARNYWWSSPKSTPVETAPTLIETPPAPTPPPPTVHETVLSEESVSTVAASTETVTPPAEPPLPAEAIVPDELATSFVPPLHYGDLAEMGLISWTPAGLVRWLLEILNVGTGLPWFWTIVVGTVLSRILILPLTISAARNAAKLAPFAKDLAAIKPELDAARATGDMLKMQRAALKQRAIYGKSGVNLMSTIMVPLVQFPVIMGFFFGIKKMCTHPVEQLKHSGFDILPDLTAVDGTYGLATLSTVIINLQVKLGMKDIDTVSRPEMAHMMNGLRILSVISIPFMSSLPIGVFVSLISGMCAVFLQTYILQQPAVRRYLSIPPQPHVPNKPPPPSMLDTARFVRQSIGPRITAAKEAWRENQKSANAVKRR